MVLIRRNIVGKQFLANRPVDISAILPIYNVYEYLNLAVTSLLSQTMKNIEIILVDDGSSDESGRLADQLEEENDRVYVLHQKNSGAAAARNLGISQAKGKYLYFMDPDDWAKPNMLKSMFDLAEESHAQLIMAGFTNKYDDGHSKYETIVKPDACIYQSQKEFREEAHIYLNNTMLAVPWNKLYLRNYILENRITFPSVKWDDLHFNLEAIRNIEKVGIVNNTDYQFLRTRPGSETTKVFDQSLFDKRKQQFEHVIDVFSEWNVENKESQKSLNYYFTSRIFQVIQEISDNENLKKYEKKAIVSEIVKDSLVQQAISGEKSGSKVILFASLPLKYKNVTLSLASGKMVSIIKNKFDKFFNVLRVKVMKV